MLRSYALTLLHPRRRGIHLDKLQGSTNDRERLDGIQSLQGVPFWTSGNMMWRGGDPRWSRAAPWVHFAWINQTNRPNAIAILLGDNVRNLTRQCKMKYKRGTGEPVSTTHHIQITEPSMSISTADPSLWLRDQLIY